MSGSKIEDLLGKRLKFTPEKYSFTELYLKQVNSYLLSQKHKSISSLDQIHLAVDQRGLFDLYNDLYRYMESDEFMAEYKSFLKNETFPLVGKGHYFQRKPNIRIHIPGGKTVQYHTDEWYGHGNGVSNFWMPLTKASGSNSLQLVNLEDSLMAEEEFRLKKATMSEMNLRLGQLAKPVEGVYGDLLVFNSKFAHGTESNQTKDTRVSIDFRTVAKSADFGSRDPREYYVDFDETDAKPEANIKLVEIPGAVYFYPRYGFTKNIRIHYQRLICNEYAKKKNIKVVSEETEVQTMAHHPLLQDLAQGIGMHNIKSVVIFSVMCLPLDWTDRSKIYELALSNGIKLFFANEHLDLPSVSIDQIENERKKLNEFK